MRKLTFLLLLSASVVVICGGDTEEVNHVPPQPPISSSSTTSTTSIAPPKPTNSTTPKTTTTTTSTTTTTTTTSTTTEAPITPPPKPAPKPPHEDPKPGFWNVTTTSNKTCVLAKFAIQIEVPYMRTENKTENAFVNVPINATASGSCNNNSNILKLQWTTIDNVTDSVEFEFVKGSNNTVFNLTTITASLGKDDYYFPGHNDSDRLTLYHTHSEFSTTIEKCYKCAKLQTLNLTSSTPSNKTVAKFHVSHVQLEAFHNATGATFGDAEDCEPFDTPDVVPIAVGCALAALVIIVLIAYLIGRRRSQARGYLSMFTETRQESDYIPMKNLNCFN